MCGIVGFTGNPDKEKLQAMLGCITHRGPDDEAGLNSPNFTLGMRRLAIIDLTNDIYPIKNEEGNIFCVFNGEIYNYQHLRDELRHKGHQFVTNSDSEVIIHGYEEWGAGVLDKLRGMFAFALYDHRKEELFLARDRLGIKPLYYSEIDNRLVFASEIKAIFNAWPVGRKPSDKAVYRFLLTRVHDDSKETFFENVKRLLPAHYMIVERDGNYRVHKYWHPKVNSSFRSTKSDTEYASEIREKFVESMKLHLITDVPLGVNLSGGLDSSAVASVAAKLIKEGTNLHTNNRLLTFSAIHPGETIDETEYIDEVVSFTNAESHKIIPSLETFWEEVDEWMYFQEEPTISTAPYAYYVVMREAHKYVKVLLSGQGGDELFAGYVPYFMSYVQTARDANAFIEILRESVKGFDVYKEFFQRKLKQMMDTKGQISMRYMLGEGNPVDSGLGKSIDHSHSRNLNERLRFDLTEGSVPNLLRYEDKNSMANSIESRVPFLDHEFVELALSLPADQKIKNGWNRWVYRNAIKGLIPEKNRQRRNKVGFVNTEWKWLRLKADVVREIFSSDTFRSRGYWDATRVLSEFNETLGKNRRGDWLAFWRILAIELWLRNYVDDFKVKS